MVISNFERGIIHNAFQYGIIHRVSIIKICIIYSVDFTYGLYHCVTQTHSVTERSSNEWFDTSDLLHAVTTSQRETCLIHPR